MYVTVNRILVMATKDFGQSLKEWRVSQELTQRDLSDAMGVSRGYIGDIEAGRSEPSRNFLIRLQERFGLRADYILYGAGDPVAPETPAPPPRPAPLDQFKLMICGEEVRKIYAALGLDLPSETHFKEVVWFYNELLSRMTDPEDGDELEALLPDIRQLLKTRLSGSTGS
ncbi:helix-turn-helix domain-containing protein [Roseovarius sp. E0-M6]|uniref:helix-turn-helix domain-containing protein n=1 Tax=Roseovarius sp. E0-M6 TaxID=3127118 RepID=UPI00300FD128